jgi:phage shock protein A
MGLFSRIFKVGQAEANSVVDKLENPIKLAEQGIRDLKKDLDKSLQALAEVKAAAIRSKRDLETAKNQAQGYEAKAIQLVQKAERGEISVEDADRLATEVLSRKDTCDQDMARHQRDTDMFDKNIRQLDANVSKLRSAINKYENELKTLKARASVSAATKKLNKSLSNVDSSGTISMLERMKEKVDQDEALSEAYGDIAGQPSSLDDEIDSVLGESLGGSDALAALKAKMKNNA